MGVPGVPIGAYTRQLLGRLQLTGIPQRNTVSNEPNAASITSRVALGSADAGFVFGTDFRVVRERTRLIRLPSFAQPPVRYQLCVVRRRGVDRPGAQAFVRQVVSSRGRAVLRRLGFGLPPRGTR
jgi:molybdate transport system substrate-binding protein